MIRRMKRCLWLLLISSPLAYAVKMTHLYEGRVLARGSDVQTQQAAFQEAFQQVLIKVTGQSSVIHLPLIQTELIHPERYLIRYGYVQGGFSTLWFQVTFSAPQIRELLKQTGIPEWSADRPAMTLWVSIQDGDQSRWIEATHPFAEELAQAAKDRGIPMILPAFDQQELTELNWSDSSVLHTDLLRSMTHSYQTDYFLVGSLQQLSEASPPEILSQWSSQWQWCTPGGCEEIVVEPSESQQIFRSVVGQVTDRLAKGELLAQEPLSEGIHLIIDNIPDFSSYLSVVRQLEQMEAIRQITLVSVQPTGTSGFSYRWQVVLQQSSETLRKQLNKSHQLSPLTISTGQQHWAYQASSSEKKS